MAVRPVRIYGDPVLRQKSAPVTAFDDSLRALVSDMFDTMAAYNGVGLAANQVGVAQRVFVVDVPREDGTHDRFAVINPVLERRQGHEKGEEGCLSMPGIVEDVVRSESLVLKGFDEFGVPFEREVEGYLARAIQHEADHVDGVLFTDRLSIVKRQLLRKKLDELIRGEVPEGYHPGKGEGASS
ncbi:MAG: peptide deformylase [Candidatus Eisenbacteria bacterium]